MGASLEEEIKKRRTFAIISHPDAGKTTLTEKFLLYGGAINTAGSVKGKANSKYAVSDWMEIEKERGISVTSSVLQFNYDGYCINILDTPGHQDFSEDTYRTLMAADSAVMVIDASKGVEAQTIKLFKVCVMRHIPIFTFINKMDLEARDSFELLDEIENVLGIRTCPINWPIGAGKRFKGVYDRDTKKVSMFQAVSVGGAKSAAETDYDVTDPALKDAVGDELYAQLMDEIELLDGASDEFDQELVDKGRCIEKQIAIRLNNHTEHSIVHADKTKIEQVIYNLLDNAIKFTPNGKSIYVTLSEKHDKIFVSVKDEGCGIPKDSLNRVWVRFYKADRSRGKDKQGTGLGLAITKEIIKAHNENINVVSTEGVGSEFTFSLSKATTDSEQS